MPDSAAPASAPLPGGDWVSVRARRLLPYPIIEPQMFRNRDDGGNINGPTLLRAPAWMKNPLGRYYLYFAHHGGRYIRLAVADRLTGPWRLHEGGVLALEQLPVAMGHIASPEVLVDAGTRRLILYYHGTVCPGAAPANPGGWQGQLTFAATSEDGVTFRPGREVVASFYLRVFRHGGWHYGICKSANTGNQFGRSADPLGAMEPGPEVLPNSRHVAVFPEGNTLWVFFSRAGDCPEQILMTRFNLAQDWTLWGAGAPPPVSVLKPETDWEGTRYALTPSRWGAGVQVRQVRDPFVFAEDGRLHLLYSVAGEMGIAIAELEFAPAARGPLPA
jgi:hypothetical protein